MDKKKKINQKVTEAQYSETQNTMEMEMKSKKLSKKYLKAFYRPRMYR